MIEVELIGNLWRWTMIAVCGRVLVERGGYECQRSAIEAARVYRAAFFVAADPIDHRQGACA